MVKSDDYIVSEGVHEAIVSEELWNKAHEKRKRTGVGNIKTHSLEHEHKLSGILKCPSCGSPMYGNVNRKRKKDGTYYKDSFYYVCKHQKLADGKICTFRRQPPQDKIDLEVYLALRSADIGDLIIEELKEKMLEMSDKEKIERELEGLEKTKRTLKAQIQNINTRLDELDIDDIAYQMKYDDLVFDQDKKYTDLARVKEEIREVDRRLRQEIIISNSAT